MQLPHPRRPSLYENHDSLSSWPKFRRWFATAATIALVANIVNELGALGPLLGAVEGLWDVADLVARHEVDDLAAFLGGGHV